MGLLGLVLVCATVLVVFVSLLDWFLREALSMAPLHPLIRVCLAGYGEKRARAVLDMLPFRPKSLLDFGGGHGAMASALRGRGVDAVVCDLDERRCLYPQWFLKNDADRVSLDISDGAFDVVTCVLCLHHIEAAQQLRLIREFLRVGRGGCLIVEEEPGMAAWCRLTNGNLLRETKRWHRSSEEWERLLNVEAWTKWPFSPQAFCLYVTPKADVQPL